jgi:hypothetical protein
MRLIRWRTGNPACPALAKNRHRHGAPEIRTGPARPRYLHATTDTLVSFIVHEFAHTEASAVRPISSAMRATPRRDRQDLYFRAGVGKTTAELLRWSHSCGKGVGWTTSDQRHWRGVLYRRASGSLVGSRLAGMDRGGERRDRSRAEGVGRDPGCCYHATEA